MSRCYLGTRACLPSSARTVVLMGLLLNFMKELLQDVDTACPEQPSDTSELF